MNSVIRIYIKREEFTVAVGDRVTVNDLAIEVNVNVGSWTLELPVDMSVRV